MVDINNDGWFDIYVCNAGYQSGVETANQLYINNKDLTFTEKAAEYGLDDRGYTTHAAFLITIGMATSMPTSSTTALFPSIPLTIPINAS